MAMEPMALPCLQSLDLLAGSNIIQLELVPLNLAPKHVLDVALTTSLTTILVLYANFNFTYLVLAVTQVFQGMLVPLPILLPNHVLSQALLTHKVALLTHFAVQMVPQVIPLVPMLTMVLRQVTKLRSALVEPFHLWRLNGVKVADSSLILAEVSVQRLIVLLVQHYTPVPKSSSTTQSLPTRLSPAPTATKFQPHSNGSLSLRI